MSKPKVAFLTNFVSPYRVPVLQHLSRAFRLSILVNGRTEFDRKWETDVGDLDVRESRTWTRRRTIRHPEPVPYEEVVSQHIPVGLFGDLRRLKPDVIISGELGPRSLIAVIYGRLFRVPVVLWSYHSHASSAGVGGLRGKIWRWLLRRSTAVVGMGTQARAVLTGLGVPDSKIFDAWNTPDAPGLRARLASPECVEHTERIQDEVGDGRKVALVLGRLIPLKGIPEILTAWRALPEATRDRWRLVFVGDGPFRDLVESAKGEGVLAVGSVPIQEVPDWYSAADLHIFASLGDVWGLVVNESQLCGTATLCSIHAGCSDDLVVHGESGLLFDPSDGDACAAALKDALERTDLEEIGRLGRESAERCTVERFAQGFMDAVEFARPRVAERSPHPASAAASRST